MQTPIWSGSALAVWGKASREDPVDWLPLVRHLEDSAGVAGALWDCWLSPAVRAHIGECLPGGESDGRVLVTWLAGVHDCGKATPAFAVKAPQFAGRLIAAGLDLPVPLVETRKAPHGVLGYFAVDDWLKHRFGSAASPRWRSSLAVVVGAHHGVLPSPTALEAIRRQPEFMGGAKWGEVREEILDTMAAVTGADERLASWVGAPLPATVQGHLAAVVVVADWLASDETRFPYDRGPGQDMAWDDLGMPNPWGPSEPTQDLDLLLPRRFPSLAGYSPTGIQRAAVEAAWAADRPPLIVLEAEMGSGKTEAALAAAEILAYRFGLGGVFFALPTMATSDAAFTRVRRWLEHLDEPGELSTYLAHGKAGLNDDFRGLARHGRITGIYEDGSDLAGPVVTVNTWTSGRRKGVLAPFVVGTVDQVLFGALRSRHLALRHLALTSKVVIIDEVHAADVYMRRYLCSMLTWLGAYGTPVILMSATLPTPQRAELVEAYRSGQNTHHATVQPTTEHLAAAISPDVGYPRTLLVDSTPRTVFTPSSGSPTQVLRWEEHPDSIEHLITTLKDATAGGGCVGVIRNTVHRAQETVLALQAAFPHIEVVLIHSRLLAVERARREADLRSRLGRAATTTSGNRPSTLIVVGTQVLEQSLDIDFDLLVTDLAPVDLLLQRAGRLHRHPRGPHQTDRPPLLRAPRLILTGADWTTTPVTANPGSRHVYGDASLLRASATLRAHGHEVRLPQDIPVLVEAAYDPAATAPEGWEAAWEAAEQEEGLRASDAAHRAGTFLLGAPTEQGGLLERMGFFTAGDADDGNGGRRQVRDSEDGVEVVVVTRTSAGIQPLPEAGLPEDTILPTDLGPPDPDTARTLAGCTVRLPAWTTRFAADQVIAALETNGFAGWQQSPWLAGQLLLVLDTNRRARVADFLLTYDSELGLQATTVQERS